MTIPILGAQVPIVGERPTPEQLRDELLNVFRTSAELHTTAARLAGLAERALTDGDGETLVVAQVQRAAALTAVADVDETIALLVGQQLGALLKNRWTEVTP